MSSDNHETLMHIVELFALRCKI